MSRLRIYDPESRRDERQHLLRIAASCLSNQPFKRSDGRVVSNYVQGHLVLGDPAGLRLASTLMLDVICQTQASVVAGEVSAACALVSGIVMQATESDQPLTGRYVRKDLRPYGMPGWLNAPLPELQQGLSGGRRLSYRRQRCPLR